MAGKFTDTTYKNTIDSLVQATKTKFNNPYYIFSDQKPTRVTYYSQNIEKSTLDEASGLYEAHLGNNSPFIFHRINDFFIYGIEQLLVNLEVGDYGTEAGSIESEGTILPNTITPRPGDFFSIPYLKEHILFKVSEVTTDTLDTGANIYKIGFSLSSTTAIETIEAQVEKSFNFIVNNVGTDFKTVIQDCDYDLAKQLETLIENLITHFEDIFFDPKLQTFVFNHDAWLMYDPYMIEFFIRNSVMKYGNSYKFVSHATETHKTFSMDYLKTFFYALENPTLKGLKYSTMAIADLIDDPNSSFSTRLDNYYCVNYRDKNMLKTRFETINSEVLEHIESGKYFEPGNSREFYNLWIAYFNNNTDYIKGSVIDIIMKTDFVDNLSNFYTLGITIFILEKYIAKLLT